MKGGLLAYKKKNDVNTKDTVRLEIAGFRHNFKDQCLVAVLSVLTVGFLQLVLYWRPDWRLRLTHKSCALDCADKLLITDEYGVVHVTDVNTQKLCNGDNNEVCIITFFIYKKIKYIFNEESGSFFPLRGFPEGTTCANLYEHADGLKTTEAQFHQDLFGPNRIDVPVKSVLWLLMNEVLNPFYIFQVYSCLVWFAQWYWQYTSAILFLSLMSICITIYETRKQNKALRDQVKTFSVVKVFRDQEWKVLTSTDLVPGDIIEVPANGMIDCDAVLLDGVVIMNESMLTGESVPETKTPLPDDEAIIYLSDVHKRHTLFCGTKVVQISGAEGRAARALVLRTGFSTAKGELVRSILYPKPVDQKLYRDGMKLCTVSAAIGLVAVVYTSVMFAITEGTTLFAIVINALDIITFVVPASLPAMLTIGTIYAQRRLEKAGIYCLSSKYINLSGTLDVVCFDKTGTLTADELSLCEVVASKDGEFCDPIDSIANVHDSPLVTAMAVCHSLVKVDGSLVGDSLDVALFESSNWEFIEATDEVTSRMTYGRKSDWFLQPKSNPDHEIEPELVFSVVHQYPFSSEFQRMSVVVQRALSLDLTLFLKGAPEKVADLCTKSSVPENLKTVLRQYTRQGFRVIGLAFKMLDADVATRNWRKISRSEIESDLTFLGLCVLRNDIKPETSNSLQTLQTANIRTIMVTGDNLFTAVHVARECGMIASKDNITLVEATEKGDSVDVTRTPFENIVTLRSLSEDEKVEENAFIMDLDSSLNHNALDGKTFELLLRNPVMFNQVIEQATVFGRMLPDQKATLVEKLQGLGYRVGMCGDGANDCAALKTADTGVSLCNTDASVAAPFTSKKQDISCIPLLMREGRCALATSFSLFKTLFGACWVECVAVLILARISNDMADAQYLYIDMAVIVAPTLFFGGIKPCKYLSPHPPPASLTCFETLASLLTYILLQTVYLACMWTYLHAQPWVTEWKYNYDDVTSYQNSTMFVALNVAILLPPLLFFYGPPYQKRMHTNKMLCVCLLFLGICCALLIFAPWNFIVNAFSLKLAPSMGYYCVLALLGVLNFSVSIFVESIIINKLCHVGLVPLMKQLINKHRHYVRRKQEPESIGAVDEELCAVDVFQ